ncbi:bleomycin resistance protein [Micromonospora lutea]|uniref:Bleomycin resistance protein n=1 Tax=Micromonospora lutea TaxID=419825 RepID=A0ABQ4ISZ6_9ACTN|nr:VOC family protein [Micromonospora lutea]GIJ21045.1 hypothetical protein Vlu01_16690 [Micromonospora lutea]
MPQLLSAIPVLAARDVAANTAFWVNVMGFTLTFSVDGFAGVARDDIKLYIGQVDDQRIADNTQAWLIAADIDALFEELSVVLSTDYEDASQPAMTAITDRPWGREFAVRDQAGNCVHIVAGPGE